MNSNITYLANVRRDLTAEESEQLAEYFDEAESDSEHGDDIGGREQPMATVDIQVNDQEQPYFEYTEPEFDLYSDESDFDEDGNNIIEDPRLIELLEEMRNDNVVVNDVGEEEIEPIEPNRGQKYLGQGKNNKTVWWSMPAKNEQRRTKNAKDEREMSISYSKENFPDKRSAFVRIMTSSIIETIVIETNRKARRVQLANSHVSKSKSLRHWYDTNAEEIMAFIGILLYAGAEKANLVHGSDLFDKQNMPFYRACMSYTRFQQLCRFIRFDDSRSRPDRLKHDKLAPFRYVWTIFSTNMAVPFAASKELTIDEQLLPTRNRCGFRQYIPSKPGKYGIKVFWLVDSQTNYPLAAEVYLGAQPNTERSTGIAHDLVTRLMKNYLNIGANVTMDNFFTGVELAKNLLEKRTTIVGTIRSNKKELPRIFANKDEAKKRGTFSSIFCFSGPCQLVSYTTNTAKNVLLLSTAHASEEVNPLTSKPIVIHDYNKHKGGVDTFDKMIHGYTCKRKTNRWPMALFYNIVDVAALAAYRLFESCHPLWNMNKSEKRKIFLKQLAFDLAEPHLQSRTKIKQLTKHSRIAMSLIGFTPERLTKSLFIPTVQVNKNFVLYCQIIFSFRCPFVLYPIR